MQPASSPHRNEDATQGSHDDMSKASDMCVLPVACSSISPPSNSSGSKYVEVVRSRVSLWTAYGLPARETAARQRAKDAKNSTSSFNVWRACRSFGWERSVLCCAHTHTLVATRLLCVPSVRSVSLLSYSTSSSQRRRWLRQV